MMRASVCNTNQCCYIDPVVLNGIGNINVICEGFVITETHDVYTLILESIL